MAGFQSTFQSNILCFFSHYAEFIHMFLKAVNKIYLTVLKMATYSRNIYGMLLRRFWSYLGEHQKGLEIPLLYLKSISSPYINNFKTGFSMTLQCKILALRSRDGFGGCELIRNLGLSCQPVLVTSDKQFYSAFFKQSTIN